MDTVRINEKDNVCVDLKTGHKIALCNIEKGADVLLTGDTKYHQMLDSKDDINIIDAGHFGTECIVTEIFAEALCDMGIQVFWQDTEDVFKYL